MQNSTPIMFITWLKRLLGIIRPSNKDGETQLSQSLQKLDKRKRSIQREKEAIRASNIDWYKISSHRHAERSSYNVFYAYNFDKILSLKELKEERLRKEAEYIALKEALKEALNELITNIDELIEQRKAVDAKNKLNAALEIVARVKDSSIRQRLQNLHGRLHFLEIELQQEELDRLKEEKQRRQEEAKRKREAQEKERKEKERREREEEERRKAEAARLAEAARQKEEAERQERQRLENPQLKDDWKDFKNVLDENGITHLYHFTDESNIASIKRHGGLYSWHYCHTHHITIPHQGGDEESQRLDTKYGLEDYVRLSFCEEHPMAYRLKKAGRDIRLLKIKAEVALLKDVQFSNMNAADKLHTHGKTLEHLRMVDFYATKQHPLSREDPKFKSRQAEVMVKTFIPLKYIINL